MGHATESSTIETLSALLEGHTSRADEARILAVLRAAPAAELDAVVTGPLLGRLLEDVDDRVRGPDNRTALLQLLSRERLGDLGGLARAEIVRALQKGRTGAIAEATIRDVFLGTRGAELAALKAALDPGDGYHDLHQLVFHDVDDVAIRAEILAHLAAEAAGLQGQLRVLSDVDDTLYANWKDARYPGGTVYPGALSFYRELGGGLVFVTARPGDRAGFVESRTLRTLRERGVATATVLCGTFSNLIGNDRIAAAKYDNFKEYRQLYPEHRFVFTGDSGQGDVAFGEMLLADESGAVLAVFIHDVVATPEEARRAHRARRVHFFDTYAGAALEAHGLGLIAAEGLARVGHGAREELELIAFEAEVLREERRADLARDLARIEQALAAAGG